MALLSLQNITVSFGQIPLLDDATLQIERGERVCLLGRNGTGKSTLLQIAAGDMAADAGLVIREKGAVVARLPQEVPQNVAGTVFEVVQGDSDAPEYEVEAIISRLGLDGGRDFAQLSGGLKRRAFLGRMLAQSPDVLLLDEPTNHLDIESITYLEDWLLRYVKTLLFVTHDRAFLRRLATRIVEVDRGALLSWDCDYDTYLVRKEAALDAEAKQNALFDKRLKEEEAWIRRGVEARRTKSQARIRDLMQMRQERSERRNRAGNVRVVAQDAQKSGRLVVEAEEVAFSYDETPIVRDFSSLIMRGDKIGVIGPNGAGKTSLLRLLLGELQPQAGEIRLGTNLQIAYFDQLRAGLEEEKSVRFNVAGDNDNVFVNGTSQHVVGYLQEFLFSSERIQTAVKLLSGGERNRLLLAKLFAQPANVLVMDEPTNDLDIETLDILENLLVEFKGTILVVSHDRDFLDNVVTSTLASEGDGKWRDYAGGYSDYLRQKPQAGIETPKATTKISKSLNETKTRRMSFKEKRELEDLPTQLEKLEKEQAQLTETLSDPAFYQTRSGEASVIAARLSEIENDLLEKFARWEVLLALDS